MTLWRAGKNGSDSARIADDRFFELLHGLGLPGAVATLGTSGAPQAGGSVNNVSLGSTPVILLDVYPANGALVVINGVVPQKDRQIMICSNINRADPASRVGVQPEAGGSTAQNRFFAISNDEDVTTALLIPSGCCAAFLQRGPIGVNGRWQLLWCGGAVFNSLGA